MLKFLLRFILGTFFIQANGNTERFLNELRRRKIRIFELSSSGELSISFVVYKLNYKQLRLAAEYTHTTLNIEKSYGLAYMMRNYRKRYGFVVGALVFTIIFYVASLFIWNIEISGCKKTTKQEVLLMLENSGFSTSSLRSKVNVKRVENLFLKNTDKISWISINLKGTSAYVEIREVDKPPELIDAREPCSIYASRDGVIASIDTYMGYSVVSPGDTVTAGDVVVTGNYTDKYGVEYKLHSYAKVMAYTIHSHTVTVPFDTKVHIKTGKTKNKYSLKLIRFVLPLYFNKNIRYNNYDVTTSEKKLKLGKYFALPLSIVKTTYTEVEHTDVTKSYEAAIADAYEQLYDFEYNLVGIVVSNREYEHISDKNGVTVKVNLECYEDIGIQGKLE